MRIYMLEFLRDPVWQFVGAALAVIAIVVSIILFFVQRRRKALTYEIVSHTSVLSVAEEVAGKLQILFQGEPVRKVHLLVLRLTNTGSIPITSGDYEREVRFSFSGDTKILTTEVSETSPDNLGASVVVDDRTITLKPVLLNSGDSITIKSLVSQSSDDVIVDGRIVGVRQIEKKTDSANWSFAAVVWGAALALGGFFASEGAGGAGQKLPITSSTALGIVLLVTGAALILVGLFRNPRGVLREMRKMLP
jgi:hypothetical protein